MKKIIIYSSAFVAVGVILWFVFSSSHASNTNTRSENQDLSGINANIDRAWHEVVAGAQLSQSFSYGGFDFLMPANMQKSVGTGGVTWVFPIRFPDTPSMTFTLHEFDTAADLVQAHKDTLPAGQHVVREGLEQIHGQQWQYIEVTTNLNYTITYWVSDHKPTVQVDYIQGRSDVMDIFDKVIHSAKAQ